MKAMLNFINIQNIIRNTETKPNKTVQAGVQVQIFSSESKTAKLTVFIYNVTFYFE